MKHGTQEIAVLKMHIVNYAKSRDVFAAYQSLRIQPGIL